jgi:hypothetical protein
MDVNIFLSNQISIVGIKNNESKLDSNLLINE